MKDMAIGLTILAVSFVFLLSTGITVAEEYKCAIITHPDFVGKCEELADWKTKTGISTKVVDTTWINNNYVGFDGIDLPAKIKDFINDSYWDGTRYIILAGDVDKVPTRYAYVNDSNQGDGKYVPCDLYYADVVFPNGTISHWDLNGDGFYGAMDESGVVPTDTPDMRPDVYIGRLPATSKAELNTLIDKIVKYEINAYNPDWVKKATLVADDGCLNDSEYLKDQTEQYFMDWGVPQSDIQKLYGASCSADNIQNAINDGRRFINYAGHGGLNSWSCPRYTNAHAASLTNEGKTPIIAAKACYTAGFDMPEGTGGIDPLPQLIDDECIGEKFVLNQNGGGIAYLGATRVSFSYYSIHVLSKLIDRMFWEATTNHSTVGECWKYAIKKEADRHDTSISSRKVLTECVLLGDPSLRIRGRIYEDWYMLNHDPQRSGRSALKGDLSGTLQYITILDNDKLAYPAIADIDSDGKQEIVVSNEDTVRAFEGNGTHIWTYTGITNATNPPTIYDADDDGEQEVVVETHNSKLYILDAASGDYEWEYTTDDIIVSPPIVADIDQDDKQEIVFGDGYYFDENRHIYALNGDTRDELWKVTPGGYNIWQAMADVDSDGKQEIIGVNTNGIFTLNAEDGSTLWQKEYKTAACLPAIADLDNDGDLEIAFGTLYFEGFGGNNRTYVIDAATGDLEWYYDLDDWPGQISAGDVDGDGVLEIVFNTLNQDVYCLDRYDGWVYPRDGNGAIGDDYYIISAVAIADTDNDNNLEIIVGSTEGYLDIFSGSGSLERRYNLGGIVEDPAIGDVDDDGKAEIIVKNGIIGPRSSLLGGSGGVIHAETSPPKANSGVIHAETENFKPNNRSSPSKTSRGVIWYNHVPIVMNASINAADILTTTVHASDFESNAVLVLSGPNPDLVITASDISFDPVSPTTADIVTITATVHNQKSDSFTNKPFKVSFYDEEDLIGDDWIVESIPPEGAANASVEWYPSSGTHNISVIVDSGYSIPETDETNNEAEKEVVVPAAIHTDDCWQQFQKDEVKIGVSNATAIVSGPVVTWDTGSATGTFYAAPIAHGGFVYASNWNGLHKYYYNGTKPNGWPAGAGQCYGSPAYGNGTGRIFFYGPDKTVKSVNENDPNDIWSVAPPGAGYGFASEITYAINGSGGKSIYFGDRDNRFYCYDVGGTDFALRWTYIGAGAQFWSGASVIGDHVIFGNLSGWVTCLHESNGAFVDSININDGCIESSISWNATNDTYGHIFFTSDHVWKVGFNTSTGKFGDAISGNTDHTTTTPAVYNGRVYVTDKQGSSSGKVRCFYESNLTQMWECTVGPVQASPALAMRDGDVYIYVTINGGSNYGVKCVKDCGSSGTVEWTDATVGAFSMQGVAIAENETGTWIFATSEGGSKLAGHWAKKDSASVRIRITHHYGDTSDYNGVPMFNLMKVISEGATPLDLLNSTADVTMHEGRVYSINGINESPPYYWYLYINGIPAPDEDIGCYQLRDGEIVHWDYSSMINTGGENAFRPYSVMDYPAMFVHGYGGCGENITASQSAGNPPESSSTDLVIAKIRVRNNGTGDADNFDVTVLLDGEPYATTTVSVAAKAERFVYLPVPKDCNVTVRLDSKNVINESDETNNEVAKQST